MNGNGMSSSILTIEKGEGVATLTLNRPKAMNALSQELRRALVDAFEALENDDEARVLVVTGSGPRHGRL
jgi:enoyl-CoA hydratase/carnithine racemase